MMMFGYVLVAFGVAVLLTLSHERELEEWKNLTTSRGETFFQVIFKQQSFSRVTLYALLSINYHFLMAIKSIRIL